MANTTQGRALTQAHKLRQVRIGAAAIVYGREVLSEVVDPADISAGIEQFKAVTLAGAEQLNEASTQTALDYLASYRKAEVGALADAMPTATGTFNAAGALEALDLVEPMAKSYIGEGMDADAALQRAYHLLAPRALQEPVLAGGREAIERSTAANPDSPGWRRVADAEPCAFCAMLVTRGPVYNSPEAAGQGRTFHPLCGCTVEESFGVWMPTTQEQSFIDAYHQAEGTSTSARTAAIREHAAVGDAVGAGSARTATTAAQEVVETGPSGFLSREQYDVLAPQSAWSEEHRQEILDTLGQSEEGRILADTLARFQDGGSIARLRTNIEKRLAGETLDATTTARVDSLLDAIRNAPDDWAPETLYRGMTVKGTPENVLKKYLDSDHLDLSLTSFSSDRKIATKFQQMTRTGKGRETRVMVELVGENKKAIPIQNLPKDKRLFKEKEWVGAGRYQIVEAKKSGGGILLRIKQIATL